VLTITVGPIWAQAGVIDVRSDVLEGTGDFIAPNDASVEIINNTPAYLELMGITIPDVNGGVYFNGNLVDELGDITDANSVNAGLDNAQSFAGVDDTVAAGAVGFDMSQVAGSSTTATVPTITVKNTCNVAADTNPLGGSYSWPDITVLGTDDGGEGIYNDSGSVTFSNYSSGSGDIRFEGTVRAEDITVIAGGDVYITGLTNYTVSGEPADQLGDVTGGTTSTYGAGSATAAGVTGASTAAVAAVVSDSGTQPYSMYGDRIHIEAEYININGIMQSGRDSYTVTINDAAVKEAMAEIAAGESGKIYLEQVSANTVGFDIYFNTATNQFEVSELRTSGGYIELYGNILNTGSGEIRVLGEYAAVTINNETSYDVLVNELDISQRGQGTLLIVDKANGTPQDTTDLDADTADSYTSLYQWTENGIMLTTNGSSDPDYTGTSTLLSGDSFTYQPNEQLRYGWTTVVTAQITSYKYIKSGSWGGIIPDVFQEDDFQWDYEVVASPPTYAGTGPYYYFDTSGNADISYTYATSSAEVTSENIIRYWHNDYWTWYGSHVYEAKYKQVKGWEYYYTHTLNAHQPIAITFIGEEVGSVTINSTGGGDVILGGAIITASGDITIDSTGAIESVGEEAYLAGKSISLEADENIGTTQRAVATNLSDPDGNWDGSEGLYAVSESGDVVITEVSGDLYLNSVTAKDGDVVLSADGGILVAQDTATTFHSGTISGASISLTAESGGIGNGITANAPYLIIDSGFNASASEAANPTTSVSVSATGDVYLQEADGDLRVDQIVTTGDVYIDVVNGDLLDANDYRIRDDRTYEELKAGVWADLQLVGSDAADKLNDTISAYEAAKEREYRSYWIYRSQQADPSVYDSSFQVTLSLAEEDYYRTSLGYDDAAIETLENKRTAEYHTLNTQFETYFAEMGLAMPTSFDASFTYVLTTSENTALTSSIKVWTETELANLIGGGLLKSVTDTQVTIENANIVANDLNLTVGGAIGDTSAPTQIVLDGHYFTDDERVAMAAAERADVSYLSTDLVDATVTFTFDDVNSVWTLTRLDLSDWTGFSAGMNIIVRGNTANETEGLSYYTIDAVNGNQITLSTGDSGLVAEAGKSVQVAGIVLDPTSETAKSILIENRDDVNVNTSGLVTITAEDDIYLGSAPVNGLERLLQINTIVAGSESDPGDIRIKVGAGISNGAADGVVNISGGNLLLEAGDGGIGTADKALITDLWGNGTITARATESVYLTEQDNMYVESIYSKQGIASLTAGGNIVDALGNDFTKVKAVSIVLNAGGTIGEDGSPADYLEVDTAMTGSLKATAQGSIWLTETYNDMNVDSITSVNGDVNLVAHQSIVDFVDDASGLTSRPETDIFGNSITLWARYGGIGNSGNDLDIDSRMGGSGTLTAESYLNTYLIETVGDLYLNTVSTGGYSSMYTAFIAAPNGSIKNGRTSGANILSGKTYLFAAQDIGEAGNSICTEVANLEGQSTAGSTWIDNDGAMIVGGVVNENPLGISAGGSITTITHSPLTVDKSVTAAGDITMTASDSGTGDDLVIKTGITLESTGGSVYLNGGDNLTIENGARIVSDTGNVIISGDAGDSDPDEGSIITISGEVSAQRIEIYGGSDDDQIVIDTGSAITASDSISISSNGGNDSIVFDTGSAVTAVGSISILSGDEDDTIVLDTGSAVTASGLISISSGDGNDTVLIDSPDIFTGDAKVYGGSGNDIITVTGLHSRTDSLTLDGEGGTDEYTINVAGSSSYAINVSDTGTADDGTDHLTINGTADSDTFLLRKNFVAYLNTPDTDGNFTQAERINYDQNINARLRINGLDGDDYFYSDDNSCLTTLDGGAGNDTFQIGQLYALDRIAPNVAAGDEIETRETTLGFLSIGTSQSMVIYGGSGDDRFSVYSNKGLLKMYGEDGNDEFAVRSFLEKDGSEIVGGGKTELFGGSGDDTIYYSINAPLAIDGGSGADKVVALGTAEDDAFVITENGIYGAGLNIGFENVELAELDGLEGDDEFFILSTSADMATYIIGGLGSDTFNVGGNVTSTIYSTTASGSSGYINYSVTSDDPQYDGVYVDGLQLNVGDNTAGEVVVTQSGELSVIEDDNSSVAAYTLTLDTVMPAAASFAYITVSAARSTSEVTALDATAGTVLVSADGVNFSEALVLRFDSESYDNWSNARTIYVKAASDTAKEGVQTALISHSIIVEAKDPSLVTAEQQKELDSIADLSVKNVEVTVYDNDKADVIVTEAAGGMTVLEGAATSVSLVLNEAPAAGETVTVSLNYGSQISLDTDVVTFDSSNWNTPRVVTVTAVDDNTVENTSRESISFTVSSSDSGSEFNNSAPEAVEVIVKDNDSGGVLITQTGGSTYVDDATSDTFEVSLQKAPAAGTTVTVNMMTDGQTLLSSIDSRFDSATQTVTFSDADWDIPVVVQVDANSSTTTTGSIVQSFSMQAHTVDQIKGPLILEGGVSASTDRTLTEAVMLPTEHDDDLTSVDITIDESIQTDTLNVFNDGSVSDDSGVMTENNISGLGMGSSLTLNRGTDAAPDYVTYAGGISYAGFENIEVMLGKGDDNFVIDSTLAETITTVHGGGGSDHLVANIGEDSGVLILFGDTSQDGTRYADIASAATVLTGNAYEYNNPGNDVIDASGSLSSVTIYGGIGDDIIYGSQVGDQLAGGSGNDEIYGLGGDDHIYGDSGFNVDVSTRFDLAGQILTVVNEPAATDNPETRDPLTAGQDSIDGGEGDDIILGDFGEIEQQPGIQRITETGAVTAVRTTNDQDGDDDTIDGGSGSDVILGGGGSDVIDAGAGNNVVLGDTGAASFTGGQLTSVVADSTGTGNDQITSGSGSDVILGGGGSDVIDAGAGNNVVLGDTGAASFTGGQPTSVVADSTGTGNDQITSGSGSDVILGGGGSDSISAGAGNNVVLGDTGELTFSGTGLSSIVADSGTGGNDQIISGTGADILIGGAGSDTMNAGGGNNLVLGDTGVVTLSGGQPAFVVADSSGTGDDRITSGGGNDVILGGAGSDVIGAGAGNNVVLGDTGELTFSGSGVSSIVSGSGASGDDQITGENGADILIGGGGSDTINGNGGNDILLGDDGSLTVSGASASNIETTGGSGNDVLNGGAGSDIMLGGAGSDTMTAAGGDNLMLGDTGVVLLSGGRPTSAVADSSGSGADRITGSGGSDVILGGNGSDTLNGGAGSDVLVGDTGTVTYSGTSFRSVETGVDSGGGNDVIDGGSDNDYLLGGGGADRLYGSSGNDIMIGDFGRIYYLDSSTLIAETTGFFSGGDDVLDGGSGLDVMFGGHGYDTFYGDWSEDVIFGDYGKVIIIDGNFAELIFAGLGQLEPFYYDLFSFYPSSLGSVYLTDNDGVGDVLRGGFKQLSSEQVARDWGMSSYFDRISHGGANIMKGKSLLGYYATVADIPHDDQVSPASSGKADGAGSSVIVMPNTRQPVQNGGSKQERSQSQNLKKDDGAIRLEAMAAGLVGWSTGAGRKSRSDRRLKEEDMATLLQSKEKSWRWDGTALRKESQGRRLNWQRGGKDPVPVVYGHCAEREAVTFECSNNG